MLGREPQQLAGVAVRDLTHPAHHEDDREAMRALAAGEQNTYSAEKRYLRADGSEAWVALHVTVVRNADGGPQYFLSQMADIGERRAAEHALAQSEERFRTLASASPVGVFADRRGRPAGLRQRAPARDLRHAAARCSTASPGSSASRPRTASASSASSAARGRWASARRSTCASWPASTAGRASTWRPSRRAPDQPMGLVGTIEDVTVEVTARMALAAREAEYRMLAEHSTDFLSRHTIDGTFLYASPVSRAMLGWDSDAMLGRTPKQLDMDHPDDMEIIERNWVGALREERSRTAAYRARRRDGSIVWLETTFRAVRGPGGEALEMVCVSRDISERKSAELELAHRALHDGLTGLPNRALFLDRLGQALRRSRRRDRGVAVVFLDLDRFKLVNDSLGHKAGDRLLVDVAMRLSSALRPSDTLARFGGDELTLLCEDIGDGEDARAIAAAPARHLRRALRRRRTARPSCRRASASRSRATASRRPRTSSATPTPRCTAPRPAARASSSSTRPCARTCATASRSRPRCVAASGAASCACTASRWSRSPMRASRASRRSCAGSTPSAASCRPGRSSRWPRRPG